MRYDFGQLVDISPLEPEMGIAETAWDGRELASTERHAQRTYETGEHGCVKRQGERVREAGDLGRLEGGVTGRWTAPEEAACGRGEGRGSRALGG